MKLIYRYRAILKKKSHTANKISNKKSIKSMAQLLKVMMI